MMVLTVSARYNLFFILMEYYILYTRCCCHFAKMNYCDGHSYIHMLYTTPWWDEEDIFQFAFESLIYFIVYN